MLMNKILHTLRLHAAEGTQVHHGIRPQI